MPIYIKIVRQIIKSIEEEGLKQGEKLPSIEILMKQYKVSKNTILKALTELEKQSYIYQVRGSGSFVRKPQRSGYINLTETNGLRKNLKELDLETKMLDLQIIKPTPEVLENLNVERNEEIYYVKRLRLVKGKAYSIEVSYYPKSIVPYLNKEIIESSIFEYLTNNLKLNLGFTDHYLKIHMLNEEDALLFDLNNGDPSFLVESIFFLKNGKPFDYSKVLYHYENAQFFIQGYNYFDM